MQRPAQAFEKGPPQSALSQVVSVEVIKTIGCVSVLPRWREFSEYNLRSLAGEAPPVLNKPKPSEETGKGDVEADK